MTMTRGKMIEQAMNLIASGGGTLCAVAMGSCPCGKSNAFVRSATSGGFACFSCAGAEAKATLLQAKAAGGGAPPANRRPVSAAAAPQPDKNFRELVAEARRAGPGRTHDAAVKYVAKYFPDAHARFVSESNGISIDEAKAYLRRHA